MPYKRVGKCVHKLNADGSVGPKVPGGCHKTAKEADAHLKALYANVKAAAPNHNNGMMVAVYPHPDHAAQLAIDHPNALPADDLHCTLAYMGKVDEMVPSDETIEKIKTAMAAVAENHQPMRAKIGGLGQFPEGPDGIPVFALVDAVGLDKLRVRVVDALEEAGLPAFTDHGYAPHMTLTYVDSKSKSLPKPAEPVNTMFNELALEIGSNTYSYALGVPQPSESDEPIDAPAIPVPPPSSKQRARFYFAEGDRAPDGRVIDPGATNFNRPPPLPIRIQTTQAGGGHEGAVIAGAVENVARFGNVIVGDGFIDLSQPAGQQLVELATNGTMQTWSPDMGDAKITSLAVPSGPEIPGQEEEVDTHFTSCTLLGFTVCALPAMGSAVFELLNDDGSVMCAAPTRGPSLPGRQGLSMMEQHELMSAARKAMKEDHMYLDDFANISVAERKKAAAAGEALPDGSYPIRNKKELMKARQSVGRTNPADQAKVRAHIAKRAKALGAPLPKSSAIAACAGPTAPPAEWFTDPELTELQQFVTIEDSGRVYFHLAPREGCHIGYKNMCVTPPADDDFSYFHHAQVQTADGEFVATGPVALRGGHAPEGFSALRAQAHYDDPATGIMDVCLGWDEFGIWAAGALRPEVTENDIARLRASGVSGDWREIDGQLRLIGICSVNTPGFPKVRLAASGAEEDGDVTIEAIIGMGTDPDFNEECDDCFEVPTLEDRIEELESRIVYLHELVASAGIEDKVFEELRASIDG